MSPRIVTSGEIIDRYGITRTTLRRWRAHPDFPKALSWRANSGGVWDRVLVEAWRDDQVRPRNARRQDAVRRYRRCGSVGQVARDVGVQRETVRRWLRALGELEESEAA